MNKVDLIHGWMVKEHIETHLFDRWVDWRFEKGNYPNRRKHDGWVEAYHKVVDQMPDVFHWNIDIRNNELTFSWDGGTETIHLDYFFDDEKDQPDLKMLWHENYWDGPLSGVALYNGEHVYFNLVDEDDTGDRIFALYRMTEEIREEKFKQHKEFQEAVGYHCDHDPEVYKPFVERDEKRFREYYDKRREELNADQGEKLGEFHWFQFKYWIRPI